MPFGDGELDVVVCNEVLEHLLEPQRAAAEALRVLRPGGVFLVSVPNVAYWHGADRIGGARMTLRPYKFIVQAVVQQIDDDGNVTGEVNTEPAVVFGVDALEQWARDFPQNLSKAKASPKTDEIVR